MCIRDRCRAVCHRGQAKAPAPPYCAHVMIGMTGKVLCCLWWGRRFRLPVLLSRDIMRRILLLLTVNLGTILAHDMWIEPTAFLPATGQIVGVKLRVGQDLAGDPL